MRHSYETRWFRNARLILGFVLIAGMLLADTACTSEPAVTTVGTTAGTTAIITTADTPTGTAAVTTSSSTIAGTTSATSATGTTTTSAANPTRPAETTVILKLEGKDEPVRATLHVSSIGYSMYYDKTLHTVSQTNSPFEFAKGSRADRYQPAGQVPQGVAVYLEIGRLANMSPQESISSIRTALAARFKTIRQGDPVGIGVNKTTAQVIEAANGTEQNSALATVAVIGDGKGGSFFFFTEYALLVAQGHKARLNQMIDTFRIESVP